MKIQFFHSFPIKTVTSLAYIFTMINFGRKFFICQTIFKIFVTLLTTLGMQKDSKINYPGSVSEQRDMQKGSFQMIV